MAIHIFIDTENLSPEQKEREKLIQAKHKKSMKQEALKRDRAKLLHQQLEKEKERKDLVKQQIASNKLLVRKQGLSRTDADTVFSLCVRLRANCCCERCGLPFPLSDMKDLHCSHNYSRDRHQVRFHPYNAFALCSDCHRWFARNKEQSTKWFMDKLGHEKFNVLFKALEKPQSKPNKQLQAKITAHYRIISRILKEARQNGNADYLPFEAFNYD